METTWVKYPHLERMDSEEVAGVLELPEIWVEPKIDGANVSIFKAGDKIQLATRNRVLQGGEEFRGLQQYVQDVYDNFHQFFLTYPSTIIYAEWLVKHTIGYYRPTAYNVLYAFDILDLETGNFVRPDKRVEMLYNFNIEQIPALAKLQGPIIHEEDLTRLQQYVTSNKFLIDEKDKVGEGIVIKAFNRDTPYRNKYGRTTWGKIVRQEFKEQHLIVDGAPDVSFKGHDEKLFADMFITKGRVEKCKQKICTVEDTGWRSEYIGRLLGMVYKDAFEEELWEFIRREKVKTIDFKLLGKYCTLKVKSLLGL